MFNTFFTKVFSKPDTSPPEHVAPPPDHPTMNPIIVGRAGVLKLLLNLKPNKATGPDGIPGNLLRLIADEIADVYTLLFQASLDQGCLQSYALRNPPSKAEEIVAFTAAADNNYA